MAPDESRLGMYDPAKVCSIPSADFSETSMCRAVPVSMTDRFHLRQHVRLRRVEQVVIGLADHPLHGESQLWVEHPRVAQRDRSCIRMWSGVWGRDGPESFLAFPKGLPASASVR